MSREALHREARATMSQAFRNVVGRDPSVSELQYLQAVAWLETNYGRGWKGAMVGSNNWGAVQCGAVGGSAGCIQYEDSYPDGTKYKVSFRSYPSALAGAEDVVRHVIKLRPRTGDALSSQSPTAFRASYAMRREKYYGGFCPAATKQFGAEPARASFAKPDRDDGTRTCMQEAVNAHADLTFSLAKSIAAANGDPVVLPRGSFDDADRWWFGKDAPSSRIVTDLEAEDSFPWLGATVLVGGGFAIGFFGMRYAERRLGL